jgi:methyl-accepting chemotaxis protein
MRFSKISLATKVVCGFALILSVFVLSSGIIFHVFNQAKAVAVKTNEMYMPALVKSGELQANLASYQAAVHGYLAAREAKDITRYKDKMDELGGNLTIYMRTLEPLLTDSNTIEWFTGFTEGWDSVQGKAEKMSEAVKNGHPNVAGEIFAKEIEPELLSLEEALKNISNQIYEEGQQASTAGMELFSVASLVLYSCLGFAIACGVFIGWAINRNIKTSFSLASGKLTASGQAVGGTSKQLEDVSKSLAASCQQTGSATVETASSVAEIDSMVKNTEKLAQDLSQAAGVSASALNDGKTVVADALKEMGGIKEIFGRTLSGIDESNDKLVEISKMIVGLEEKTKVINDIVFQTKLLAFNASVEAARAGEHGKGFSVVAEEVGALSKVTGTAASEIALVLKESSAHVAKVVQETKARALQVTEAGKAAIEAGMSRVAACNELFAKIDSQIQQMNGMIHGVVNAATEQSTGIGQVTQAVGEIDQTSQKNAALAAESEKIAAELAEQRQMLLETIEVIETLAYGAGRRPAAPIPPKPELALEEEQVRKAA